MLLRAFLCSWIAPLAAGDIVVTVDKLDSSDGAGDPPPKHIVVVDINIEVTPDQTWNTLGMAGYTFGGARYQYAHDPNTGDVLYTNPGTDNRFVTFFNEPRARNGDGRFGPNAAVQVGSSHCIGQTPRFWDTELDAVFLPIGLEPDRDGYIGRIAIDLSGFANPRFRTDSDDIIVATEPPPDADLIFNTFCGNIELGMQVSALPADTVYAGFGIYGIPEPATAILAIALGGWLLRMRR